LVLKVKEKKEWFEKFNYFFTSKGLLVIAGKDATTNEIIIKKHTNSKDIVFHADITGSPFGVIKTNNQEVSKEDLEETAQFVSSYSRAWKAESGNVEVYWIYPDQVSKKAQSGQYLPKGSFMIYGKRNYLKPELAIGIGFKDNKLLSGSFLSVSRTTKNYVKVIPGSKKAKDIAKEIKARLFSKASEKEREIIRKINIDDIAKRIPYGKGEVL